MRKTTAERFWAKVEKTGDCWLWHGAITGKGYGSFWDGSRRVAAHRWSYEHAGGTIPTELQIDHLCRVRHCVNPQHLEPVTALENARRGEGFIGRQLRQTHCIRGHSLSGDNLYTTPDGRRQCRTCRAAAKQRLREKDSG